MAGPLTFDTAYRAIQRGQLARVYYLTGPEDVLKDELISVITDQALDPAARDFNLDVRAAGQLDGESFHALVETPPMLAEQRVVIVRGLEQWRKNAKVWQVLERYLDRASPTTVLVLTHAAGEKPLPTVTRHSTHVEVAALAPDRLRRWLARRAERAGIALDEDGAAHLIRAVGTDLAYLGLEIEKLAAAAPGNGPIGAAEVAELVGVRRGETPDDWVTAVLERDRRRAVGMLDTVLAGSGVSGVRLVMALGTALVGVRHARALLDAGMAPGRVERAVFDAMRQMRPAGLGSWRGEAARWTGAAVRWNAPALDRALRGAYDADRALKSTTITDERGILVGLVLEAGAERAAA
jgi:DNA polymerase-3 subunit delta